MDRDKRRETEQIAQPQSPDFKEVFKSPAADRGAQTQVYFCSEIYMPA